MHQNHLMIFQNLLYNHQIIVVLKMIALKQILVTRIREISLEQNIQCLHKIKVATKIIALDQILILISLRKIFKKFILTKNRLILIIQKRKKSLKIRIKIIKKSLRIIRLYCVMILKIIIFVQDKVNVSMLMENLNLEYKKM